MLHACKFIQLNKAIQTRTDGHNCGVYCWKACAFSSIAIFMQQIVQMAEQLLTDGNINENQLKRLLLNKIQEDNYLDCFTTKLKYM